MARAGAQPAAAQQLLRGSNPSAVPPSARTQLRWRAEVEAQALTIWQDTPADQRTLVAPPTVDEMLVSGSEANAMLTSMFTQQQQPHVIFPLSIRQASVSEPSHGGSSGGDGKGGHRRQMQGAEPEPEPEPDLTIRIQGRAPTSRWSDGRDRRVLRRLHGRAGRDYQRRPLRLHALQRSPLPHLPRGRMRGARRPAAAVGARSRWARRCCARTRRAAQIPRTGRAPTRSGRSTTSTRVSEGPSTRL